ncbi:MAG: hypothetical protein U9R39_07445 [Campylobacterota bacterium]|nr:hypothetical protein [Campylobacterota bacterium]
MKNITYIIIFTLSIALGLIYTKIINYENIADELLSENIEQTDEIKYLKSKNSTLNQTIINLENNLSNERNNTQTLEQQIILLESKLPYIDDDTNNTIYEEQFINDFIYENNTTKQTEEYIEHQDIEENQITGFN